jgi:predicted helicase
MRQSLMSTYQRLYFLDLHGNANQKEQAPDGSEDKNVFNIRQGAGICLGIRANIKEEYFHADLWGARDQKYKWLMSHNIEHDNFSTLIPDSPFYFFKKQNIDMRSEYDSGWKINDITPVNSAGFITARDHFVTDIDAKSLMSRISAFADPKISDAAIRTTYFAGCGSDKYPDGDTRGWKIPEARHRVQADKSWKERIVRCLYRPFDFRSIYWSEWMVDWPRPEVMSQMIGGDNFAILTARSNKSSDTDHFFCTNLISETKCAEYSTQSAVFPLYVFEQPSSAQGELSLGNAKRPNLSLRFLSELSGTLNLQQTKPYGLPKGITPEDVFQYIYAIFYSPSYRTRYSEFLKIDFPRIPLLSNLRLFSELSNLGKKLKHLHLLDSAELENPLSRFVGHPNSEVERISWSQNTVWIDKSSSTGFTDISEEIWNFSIGGYQICQKWLKDRKSRKLSSSDIAHYEKIIVSLHETIRTMREIDKVIASYGGWPSAFLAGDKLKLH